MSSETQKELIDEVFSWSLEDILNPDFFYYEVEQIPDKFDTIEQYYNSFKYPLLEETRAELSSSFDNISGLPYAEVVSIRKSRKRDANLLVLDLKVNFWRHMGKVKGQEPYQALAGDILLLTDVNPEIFFDFPWFGRTCVILSLSKILSDLDVDNLSATSFQVRASKEIEVEIKRKPLFVVFLMNLTTNQRIWKSLRLAGSTSIIKSILSPDTAVDVKCVHCGPKWSSIENEKFYTALSTLNESQTEVIKGALHEVDCEHRPSVNLVWGPPGTGKTKTLSTLLVNLLRKNSKTLVCAPTNIAVAEVASRVLNMVKASLDAGSGCGSELLPPGDLLLFGSKDWTKFSSNLEEIDLDCRINRLEEFLSVTGWKNCLAQMVNLLKDCVSEYHLFLENGETADNKTECKSFVEFLKARFQHAVSPLRRCIFAFFTDMPKGCMNDNTYKTVVSLSQILGSFELSLSACAANSSEKLSHLFSQSRPHECLLADELISELQVNRTHCIEILELLQSRVHLLQFPPFANRDAIMEFCFGNAALIFCTASSTYKLRSVMMKPLSYLVIDEAAQLKECESTIPLQLKGVSKAILFGDQCQLPAMLNSRFSAKVGFGRSLFERLSSIGYPKYLLNMQYRMHPSISSFPNFTFYDGQITNAPNVIKEDYERKYLRDPMYGPYCFINISCGREEKDAISSYKNMVEVSVVVEIVEKLFKAWSSGCSRDNLSVGIVSPYSGQVVAIQEGIGQKYSDHDGFSLKVKSIDGFQGGESDVLLLSTVRSNNDGNIGFLVNWQRANVALTRARHCLWILGNAKTLSARNSIRTSKFSFDPIWTAIVKDAKNRGCLYDAEEDDNLSKVMLEVKKQLDELDDLLDAGSILFKNARWKVVFSNDFRKSFQKLDSSGAKKSVVDILVRFSSGWRPKKWQMGAVPDRSSEILKQYKVMDLYLVFSVDVVEEISCWTQVLKFWDILPLNGVLKLINRLDAVIGSYTEPFLSRCKAKKTEGKLEIPMSWN